jgi:hypothetical protein
VPGFFRRRQATALLNPAHDPTLNPATSVVELNELCDWIGLRMRGMPRWFRQLDRVVASVVLNIAEGNT